jgi:hypothetical protein
MKRLNLKKILKWTGIVAGGLLAIGLVANAIFVWTTDTRLERQLAAIRAAGDPLCMSDLARPPIPPEKNANTYLLRADKDVDAIEKKLWSKIENNEYYGSPYIPMPPQIQKAVKAALDAHPNVIPLVNHAAACPDYDPQLDFSISDPGVFIANMLPKVQMLRSFVRVLQCRVWLLLAEKKYDEAMQTSLMIFRMGHYCERCTMFVGYLVAITVRGIATDSANSVLQIGPVSKEIRNALDAELATQERMEGYVWALKCDRASALDSFRNTIPLRNFWFISRGFWNRQESACLDIYQSYISMKLDSAFFRERDRIIGNEYSQIPKLSVYAQFLVPAIRTFHHAVTKTQARIRCLRVLNAIQTHTPKGKDDIPKLSELGLPVETTTDPFTGEPLKVKKTSRGWLIYSVGSDYKDDGGKIDNSSPDGDVGIGPPPLKPAKTAEK